MILKQVAGILYHFSSSKVAFTLHLKFYLFLYVYVCVLERIFWFKVSHTDLQC